MLLVDLLSLRPRNELLNGTPRSAGHRTFQRVDKDNKKKEKTIKSPINIDFAEMMHHSTLRPRDSVTA